MTAPEHAGFYMWCASEDVQTSGYWSFDPPTGGGNPSTRFIAFVPGTEPPKNYTEPEVQALIAAKLEEAVNALDGITKPAIPPGPENSVTGRAFDSGQEAAVARFKQAIGRLITPDMARALAAVKAEAWREGMALAEEIAESIETEGGGGADAAAAIRAWRAIEGVPGAAIRADGGE